MLARKEKYDLVEVVQFNDAEGFLDFVRRSNALWWDNTTNECNWLFRGQWDSDWELMPSAWRSKGKLKPLFNKIKVLPAGEPYKSAGNRSKEYCYHAMTEVQAILDFCELANQLGFDVSDELYAGSPIKLGYISSVSIEGLISTRTLAIAQHHGIPTRLLDWTRNPLYASYFAVGNEFRSIGHKPKYICVWAVNIGQLHLMAGHNIKMQVKLVNEKRNVNQYMHVQDGVFTWIPQGDEEFYTTNGRFPTLVDAVNMNSDKFVGGIPALIKLLLPYEQVDKLLLLLDREGISQAHLMPNLDRVVDTVISRWNYNSGNSR